MKAIIESRNRLKYYTIKKITFDKMLVIEGKKHRVYTYHVERGDRGREWEKTLRKKNAQGDVNIFTLIIINRTIFSSEN